jgi:hypothetical protein
MDPTLSLSKPLSVCIRDDELLSHSHSDQSFGQPAERRLTICTTGAATHAKRKRVCGCKRFLPSLGEGVDCQRGPNLNGSCKGNGIWLLRMKGGDGKTDLHC